MAEFKWVRLSKKGQTQSWYIDDSPRKNRISIILDIELEGHFVETTVDGKPYPEFIESEESKMKDRSRNWVVIMSGFSIMCRHERLPDAILWAENFATDIKHFDRGPSS